MRSTFGILRSGRNGQKNDWTVALLCCICLVFIGCFLYIPKTYLGLSEDDRYLIELLRKLRWDEFVCYNDGYRFRPVSQLAIRAVWQVCGCNAVRFVRVIPCLNILMGVALFWVSDYLFKNRLLSFAISTAYLTARFAYYQVLQLLGIMEGSALFCAIATLLFALDFIINERNRSIWFALLIYLVIIYCHERYMTLVAALLAAIWLRSYQPGKRALPLVKRIVYSAVACTFCAGALAARFILFKGNAWTGTGGTDMASTFSMQTVLAYVLKHILYLMGWGSSDVALSGFDYTQMSKTVIAATIAYDACFAGLIVATVITFLTDKRKKRSGIVRGIALIVVFVGACIIAASTTVRVEMRWVYVSYTALLIGVGMMTAYMLNAPGRVMRVVSCVLATVFFLSTCYVEFAYRQGWKNQYYYQDLVADDTLFGIVREYPDIRDREMYIIDNDNRVKAEEAERFLSLIGAEDVFKPAGIVHLNSFKQYLQMGVRNSVVIVEYQNGKYQDITRLLDVSEDQNVVSGVCYADGWCSGDVTFEITPYRDSTYELTFYTESDISGFSEEERTVYVSVNGEEREAFVFESPYFLKVNLNLNEVNTVRIQTGFVSPDVVRDGVELSYTLQIKPVA